MDDLANKYNQSGMCASTSNTIIAPKKRVFMADWNLEVTAVISLHATCCCVETTQRISADTFTGCVSSFCFRDEVSECLKHRTTALQFLIEVGHCGWKSPASQWQVWSGDEVLRKLKHLLKTHDLVKRGNV